VKRLAERLDRLAQRSGDNRRRLADAQRLRDEAERMLKEASPEERQRLQRLARMLARERRSNQSPAPMQYQTEPVAAPGDNPVNRTDAPGDQRLVGRLQSDDVPGGPGVSRSALAGRIRESVRGAERAMEQQRIPRRLRQIVRRVNHRRLERAAGLESPVQSPPPTRARDVDEDGDG